MAALSFPIRRPAAQMQMHSHAGGPVAVAHPHSHSHSQHAPFQPPQGDPHAAAAFAAAPAAAAAGAATPRRLHIEPSGAATPRAQHYQQQQHSPHRADAPGPQSHGAGAGGIVSPVPLAHRPQLVQYARQGQGPGLGPGPATPTRAAPQPFGVAAAAPVPSSGAALPVPSAEQVQAFAQLLQPHAFRHGAALPAAPSTPSTPRRHQRHSTDALLQQMQMQREQQAQQQQSLLQSQLSAEAPMASAGAGASFDFGDEWGALPDEDERKGDTERTPSKPQASARQAQTARAGSTPSHGSATPRGGGNGSQTQRGGLLSPQQQHRSAGVPSSIGLPLSFPDPQLGQASPSPSPPWQQSQSQSQSALDTAMESLNADRWNDDERHDRDRGERDRDASKKPLTVLVSSPLPRHGQPPSYQGISSPPRRSSPDLPAGATLAAQGGGAGTPAGSSSVPSSPGRGVHSRHASAAAALSGSASASASGHSTPDRLVRALPMGSPSGSPPGSARAMPTPAFPLRAGSVPTALQQPLSARQSPGSGNHGERYSVTFNMEPYTPSSAAGSAAVSPAGAGNGGGNGNGHPGGFPRNGAPSPHGHGHGRHASEAPGAARHHHPQQQGGVVSPNGNGNGYTSGSQSSRRPHPSAAQQQQQQQRSLRSVCFASEGELVRYDDAPMPLLSAARLARHTRAMLLPNGQPRPILRHSPSPSSSASTSPSPSPIPSPRGVGGGGGRSPVPPAAYPHPQPQERLRDFQSTLQLESLCVHSVRRGSALVKYDSQGRPAPRWFFVEETEAEHRLVWESVKGPGENGHGLDLFDATSPAGAGAAPPAPKRRGSVSNALPFFSIGRFKFNQDRTRSLVDVTALRYGPYWSSNFGLALERHDSAGSGSGSGSGGATPHAHPWLCFSLHFPDRSIDIVAPDEATLTAWYLGLQALAPLSVFHLSRGALLWQRLVMKVNTRGLGQVRRLVLDMHPEHHLHRSAGGKAQQQQQQQQQGGGKGKGGKRASPPVLSRAASLSNLPLPLPLAHRRSHTTLATPLVLSKKVVKAPYVPLLCVGVRST